VLKYGKSGQEISQNVLRSKIHAKQRAWLQHRCCALMDFQYPILDGQGWAKAQLEHVETRLIRAKQEQKKVT